VPSVPSAIPLKIILALLIILASLRGLGWSVAPAVPCIVAAAVATTFAARCGGWSFSAGVFRCSTPGRCTRREVLVGGYPLIASGIEILRISIAIWIGLGLRLSGLRALVRAPAATMRTSTFGHAECEVR